jgi:hypothetical protein
VPPDATTAPTVEQPTIQTTATSVPTSDVSEPPASTGPVSAIVDQARSQLAVYLGVAPDTLTLESSEARDWPDSALGCPAPDEGYMQVITPGYLLVFSSPEGQRYPVHTDETGTSLILCQDGQRTVLGISASPEQPEAPVGEPGEQTGEAPAMENVDTVAAEVQTILANHLGVAPDTLTLESSEARDWPDSALGCPAPGRMYVQVVTPGYLLVFSDAEGQRYPVHTTSTGNTLILCQDDQPVRINP